MNYTFCPDIYSTFICFLIINLSNGIHVPSKTLKSQTSLGILTAMMSSRVPARIFARRKVHSLFHLPLLFPSPFRGRMGREREEGDERESGLSLFPSLTSPPIPSFSLHPVLPSTPRRDPFNLSPGKIWGAL